MSESAINMLRNPALVAKLMDLKPMLWFVTR